MADENNDGTNWFRRHVLEKLEDLSEGQKSLLEAHHRSVESLVQSNKEHAQADAEAFADIREDLSDLKLVKQIVFTGVGIILLIVFGALIAQVTDRRNPAVPMQFDGRGKQKSSQQGSEGPDVP